MRKIYLIVIISCFVWSCHNDEFGELVTADFCINENEPTSIVLNISGGLGTEVSIELRNTTTGFIEKSVVIQCEKDDYKYLLTSLKSGEEYAFKVFTEENLVNEGQVKLPEMPQEYSEFIDVKIEGQCDLGSNYLLLNKMSEPSGVFLFNSEGKVVWSRLSDNFVKMVKLTERGTLLTLEDDLGDKFGNGNIILETTFTGDTLARLEYGKNDFDRMAHHDVVLTKNNTYAFITNVHVDNVVVDGITELNAFGTKVWEWDMASHILPVPQGETFSQPWGNSIVEDSEGNFLVSFRSLSQAWTIDSKLGNVKMKFGNGNDYGLNESDLFVNQHNTQWVDDDLLLFDNGNINNRSYSRILRYALDLENSNASVLDNIKLPDALFSPYMSAVEVCDNGYIVTSSIAKKIAKIDYSGSVVWTMTFGDRMFRSQLVHKNL